jgi:DNA-binding transcriptional ArsR family regulator
MPPKLLWDLATAYDLFISLYVLHHPNKYELRGAWAAGVRSRLSPADREMIEQATELIVGPLHWLHALPPPKDGDTVLRELAALPPAGRLPALLFMPDRPSPAVEILQEVGERGVWNDQDQERLAQALSQEYPYPHQKKELAPILNAWVNRIEFGERYLEALRAYHEVFFAEEEKRIWPALAEALAQAQEMAQQLPLDDLLEELSQGLRYSEPLAAAELVLAPSFWATPLIVRGEIGPKRELILFGARPATASLVPGEVVPDALFRALKALADPTRLRILRYLAAEPQTPAQLARRLRLRAPTVVHHLHTLRLAGLVYLTLAAGDRRYAARTQAVNNTFAALRTFLENTEKN